mmetsp:Transcript_23763/g.35465  ORF Transcript_23763/g.35465 Transcript_23763/m.35465 type:complete len:485 (-) Transcript_23763:447-1901(-)
MPPRTQMSESNTPQPNLNADETRPLTRQSSIDDGTSYQKSALSPMDVSWHKEQRDDEEEEEAPSYIVIKVPTKVACRIISCAVLLFLIIFVIRQVSQRSFSALPNGMKYTATGPYKLVEHHEGKTFFDGYEFHDGPDSVGSAGYNMYVSKEKAESLDLISIETETLNEAKLYGRDYGNEEKRQDFVYMKSLPTDEGPRDSIRLEGKRRFDRGLFVIDLHHMPAGCGVWPAFWLTDETNWPNNGEIDIVEGINYQNVAKTALHTSAECDMYQQVDPTKKTGTWDRSSGVYDRFTGLPDHETSVPAQNCWDASPFQWYNQGCVAVETNNATIGVPFNENEGGVYALEWDPEAGYIRSWVFAPHKVVPENLREAMDSAGDADSEVLPDTSTWGLPYGYFAIGDESRCSSDHFQNMRIVFNLAFCGTVAGNRYFIDCPKQAELFTKAGGWDPVGSCNEWIKSEPEELDEAYWKIRGVYVYEREMKFST